MNLDFVHLQKQLPGSNLKWLQQLRNEAFSYFENKGFPTRFDEDWKYMKTQSLAKEFENLAIQTNTLNKTSTFNFLKTEDYYVLFIDGQMIASQLPKNSKIAISSVKQVLEQNSKLIEKCFVHYQLSHSLIALNQALLSDGVVIHIAENTQFDQPIYCLFMHEQANSMNYNRHFIIAEKNSAITVVEKYFSNQLQANYFANHITDCFAEENARIEHIKIIEEAKSSFHFSHLNIHQQKSSNVKSHVFTLSGDWVRSDTHVNLNDVDVEVELNGLFNAKEKQHVDHHTVVNHFKPHGRSSENYKGIIDGEAVATFNGKVIVALDAQKTTATQFSKNLLLSKQAEINTKPELQIFADDVKCAHGATVGQLDENAVFYLCSRGLPYAYAKNLLLYGFAMEQIDKISIPLLKQNLKQSLEQLHHV